MSSAAGVLMVNTSNSLLARHWTRAVVGLCAAGFGFGLARTLFEWQPERLAFLGQWPGTLLVVAAITTVAVWVQWPQVRLHPWQTLPLALPVVHALAPDVNLLRGWTLLAGALLLTALLISPVAATPRASPKAESVLLLSLFLSLFLLYLATLAPAVGEADTFEFQVGVARLGIAHGSGYPLLMLVGKVFSLLPLGGTLAWRANLTSAFFAALAAVLVTRLARRLGVGPLPALLAGLALGVSPTLWSRAVELEAYTLNAALVAALLYLAVDLAQTGSLRRLPLLAFLFGLSLTNHLTTLLLLPACVAAVLAVLWKSREKEREVIPSSASPAPLPIPETGTGSGTSRVVLRVSSALLAGLSVYLYLPLRWPAVNNGQRLSLAQFANIVTGNEARGAFQWDLPLRDPGRYAIVFDKIHAEYGWPGLAALAFGLALLVLSAWPLLRRTPTIPLSPSGPPQLPITNYQLLFLAYLPYLYFALAFNVPDPDFSAFFIPLHLITAVLLGLGLQSLLGPVSTQPSQGHVWPLVASLVLTGFALLPLRSVWLTYPRVDQSKDWASYRLGQQIMSQPLALGATLLADSLKIAPLYYLQVAEGVRPDLDIVVLPDEASYRAVLDERIAEGRAVYLGRYLPGLGGGYALRSVGPLVEVASQGWVEADLNLLPPIQSTATAGLRLLGYTTGSEPPTASPPDNLPLTLAWRIDQPLDENLLVSLQLVKDDGQVAWRGPGRVPVGGLYPTNAWRPGEVISDHYAVPIAHTLAPGEYRLQVGLFPPFAVTETGWTDIISMTITAALEPAIPQRSLRARFGDHWLLGYALAETAAPGARVPVTLYWQRSASASETVSALGEIRSLAAWPPFTVAPLVYTLQAPSEADSFDLTVTIDTGAPARCGWLEPVRPACELPPIQLAGQAAAAGARNFDNQLLLNRATLETVQAAPGGQVDVTLEWQGLRRMTEDYTVFVHLLGPDGLVHGQVDAWPVSGTQATSRWEPGQAIVDRYAVRVPGDAPPGAYHVEIGLYLLATGQRLPLLSEAGDPIDDRLLLPGLTITSP